MSECAVNLLHASSADRRSMSRMLSNEDVVMSLLSQRNQQERGQQSALSQSGSARVQQLIQQRQQQQLGSSVQQGSSAQTLEATVGWSLQAPQSEPASELHGSHDSSQVTESQPRHRSPGRREAGPQGSFRFDSPGAHAQQAAPRVPQRNIGGGGTPSNHARSSTATTTPSSSRRQSQDATGTQRQRSAPGAGTATAQAPASIRRPQSGPAASPAMPSPSATGHVARHASPQAFRPGRPGPGDIPAAYGVAAGAAGFGSQPRPGADASHVLSHADMDLEGEALISSVNALLDEVAVSLGLSGAPAGGAGGELASLRPGHGTGLAARDGLYAGPESHAQMGDALSGGAWEAPMGTLSHVGRAGAGAGVEAGLGAGTPAVQRYPSNQDVLGHQHMAALLSSPGPGPGPAPGTASRSAARGAATPQQIRPAAAQSGAPSRVGGATPVRGEGRGAASGAVGGVAPAQRSLAELEQLLAQAMSVPAHMNTDPRSARSGDGGPFDISALWAGGDDAASASEDTGAASSQQTGDWTSPLSRQGGDRGWAGATGRPSSRFQPQAGHAGGQAAAGAGARRGGAVGGTSMAHAWQQEDANEALSVRYDTTDRPSASGQRAWERLQQQQRQRVAQRATSAPRTRPGSGVRSPQRPRSASPPSPAQAHPPVNPLSRKLVAASYPDDTAARIEQLAVPRPILQAAKHAAKRREDEEQLLAECTFAPRTGRAPLPITPQLKARAQLPVHQRLYHAGPTWHAKRDQALRARQEAELAECTFRPLTNHSLGGGSWAGPGTRGPGRPKSAGPAFASRSSGGGGSARGGAAAASEGGGRGIRAGERRSVGGGRGGLSELPLYERVGDVLRQRSEKLANARLSLELGGGSMGDGGAYGRGRDTRGAVQSGGGCASGSNGSGATFKPQVCPRSEVLAAQRRAREEAQEAIEQQQQQQQWEQRQQQQHEAGVDAWDEAENLQGQRPVGEQGLTKAQTFQRQQQQQPGRQGQEQRQGQGQGGVSAAHRGACERLYQRAMKAARASTAELSDVRAAQVDQDCTFTPAINQRSRQMVERAPHLPSSFLERQSHLAEQAAQRKAVFRNLVESAECTFRPRLGSDTDQRASVSTSGDYGSSFGGSPGRSGRLVKLAYDDVRRSQVLKEALDQHYYGQLTFSPEVNPRSRALVAKARRRSINFDDPSTPGEGGMSPPNRHSRCNIAATAVDQDMRDCTFKPDLNPRSLVIARKSARGTISVLDSVGTSLQQRLSREQRLQEARAMKEYEELKECTFTPEINPRSKAAGLGGVGAAPPAPAPLPTLAGVSRHLEQLALARRRKEEQKRVEDKVWWRNPRGNTDLFTVPKPFAFQRDQRPEQSADAA